MLGFGVVQSWMNMERQPSQAFVVGPTPQLRRICSPILQGGRGNHDQHNFQFNNPQSWLVFFRQTQYYLLKYYLCICTLFKY